MTPKVRNDLVPEGTRWTRVEHHDVVDSTNRIVAEAARDGEPAGLVVVADHQTHGRGRHGRAWEDEPGGSVLMSALVDGSRFEPSLAPLATGLALRDVVGGLGAEAELKWPNDVLLEGAKTAGILVEAAGEALTAAPLVIGIGVNVSWRDRVHEPDRTSIAEATGKDVDRLALLTRLLAALDVRLRQAEDAPEDLRADYRAACATLGRDVRVATPTGEIEGHAADLDERGALVVRLVQGTTTVIDAGDVTYVRRAT